jgi:hypothetical protein
VFTCGWIFCWLKISLVGGCLTSSAISFERKAEYLGVRRRKLNVKVQPHKYRQFFNFLSRTPRQIYFSLLNPDQRRTSNLKTRNFTFIFSSRARTTFLMFKRAQQLALTTPQHAYLWSLFCRWFNKRRLLSVQYE